jgi:hypothetical protein
MGLNRMRLKNGGVRPPTAVATLSLIGGVRPPTAVATLSLVGGVRPPTAVATLSLVGGVRPPTAVAKLGGWVVAVGGVWWVVAVWWGSASRASAEYVINEFGLARVVTVFGRTSNLSTLLSAVGSCAK